MSTVMEMFYIHTGQFGSRWLISTWNETNITEELNFKFYLILSNLNVTDMWDETPFRWLLDHFILDNEVLMLPT